ncbi:hypothetical protein [Burkholderia stagnalis]|uniref:hypothetical protein n=1 Tax=Burkholderia stagnalis TaxID=1503054 RepID=UPI0012DA66C5|nr:hypothetical protein [Burkholderia stagnalis]
MKKGDFLIFTRWCREFYRLPEAGYEIHVVSDPETSVALAEAEQIFFASFVQDPVDVIRPAIQKTNRRTDAAI